MEKMGVQSVAARPTIALAMGDPMGISPELTAKILAIPEVVCGAKIVVFGDRRILADGEKIAGVQLDLEVVDSEDACSQADKPCFVDLKHLDPERVTRGKASSEGGAFALENFRRALLMAKAGKAGAVCFTPFNKQSMRMVYAQYDDEIRYISDIIDFHGPAREFNILEKLWNARVTSHIPLAAVASSLTSEAILTELSLAQRCLQEAGFENPRIAVAGLNPHAGDGGNFGTEEIDIIAPAVEMAVKKGFNASGPYPADTVYVRAVRGEFDAVLTMYHDQGQIAMKLMGFDRGVTLLGGLPFPVCTPAHGTAYDIAGKGIANIGATREAMLLATRMASRSRPCSS